MYFTISIGYILQAGNSRCSYFKYAAFVEYAINFWTNTNLYNKAIVLDMPGGLIFQSNDGPSWFDFNRCCIGSIIETTNGAAIGIVVGETVPPNHIIRVQLFTPNVLNTINTTLV